MNEAHYTYRVDGAIRSEWASEWSDILAKYPNAVLISTMS